MTDPNFLKAEHQNPLPKTELTPPGCSGEAIFDDVTGKCDITLDEENTIPAELETKDGTLPIPENPAVDVPVFKAD